VSKKDEHCGGDLEKCCWRDDHPTIPSETSQKLVVDAHALTLATVDLIRSSLVMMANPESR